MKVAKGNLYENVKTKKRFLVSEHLHTDVFVFGNGKTIEEKELTNEKKWKFIKKIF